jgi:hypothetical protein
MILDLFEVLSAFIIPPDTVVSLLESHTGCHLRLPSRAFIF